MYLTLETLIRQGLGSEIEIKQLEMDLENVAKQAWTPGMVKIW